MLLTIGKNYLIRYWFEYGFNTTLKEEFRERALITFVTGTRLMSIWLLAYYGYHFAQREILATRETARLAIIAKDAQLNNLTAQLNPHFFFNSLNNIKALVIDNPQSARRAIDLLSEVLRTALYNRDTPLITVQQELSLISDYLELEKCVLKNDCRYTSK
ncbi:histidine kinase [Paraflavitalea speifideaquila]|uniref:histidine kinase n=1 Tax=Paraflavitalea speifideaquila TaxID=3076558 RepID=UPI0028E88EB5|nr:histidine kinase [Paraflavitalea speifideiaquila]